MSFLSILLSLPPIRLSAQTQTLHNSLNLLNASDTEDSEIELGHKLNHSMNSNTHNQQHHPLVDRSENIEADPTNHCHEYLKATAFKIKQSVQFFLLYVILIVLNAFVLIWVYSFIQNVSIYPCTVSMHTLKEVSDGGDRKICIILEGVITLMFMGEVAVQILTEEWVNYWSSWLNRIDLVMCILCVMLYLIFASVEDAPHSHYSIGNVFDAILVGIRYGMQSLRFIRFAQRGHENRKMLNQTEIIFDSKSTLSVLHEHGVDVERKKKISHFKRLKNKIFYPKLYSLIRGNSNDMDLDTIEMVQTVESEHEEEDESNVSSVRNEQQENDDEFDNMNDIAEPIKPNEDIYATERNGIGLNGFMYDSEQMAVYQDIANESVAYDSVDVDTANERPHILI